MASPELKTSIVQLIYATTSRFVEHDNYKVAKLYPMSYQIVVVLNIVILQYERDEYVFHNFLYKFVHLDTFEHIKRCPYVLKC